MQSRDVDLVDAGEHGEPGRTRHPIGFDPRMAEITPRRQGELVRGVFKILKDAPEGLQAAEVLRQLELAVPPTL